MGNGTMSQSRRITSLTSGLRCLSLCIVPDNSHGTLGQLNKTEQDIDRRGFSSSVQPEESEDFALFDTEIKVVNGDDVTEPFCQAIDIDRSHPYSTSIGRS